MVDSGLWYSYTPYENMITLFNDDPRVACL